MKKHKIDILQIDTPNIHFYCAYIWKAKNEQPDSFAARIMDSN